jgi:secreted PhoX family phosphatase
VLSTTPTIYTSGINHPFGLAFNSAGTLYVAYDGPAANAGGVVEVNANHTTTSIAAGLYNPNYLAFDTSGDLFVTEDGSGDLTEIKNGSVSTYATGLGNATGIAFEGVALPVPEPSALVLAGLGASALLMLRRRKS